MAPQRTAIVMSLSDMVDVPRLVITVLRRVVSGLRQRLSMHRANAATGQIGPPIAKWWTKAPLVPFFVLAMEMVALSARRSAVREESG